MGEGVERAFPELWAEQTELLRLRNSGVCTQEYTFAFGFEVPQT